VTSWTTTPLVVGHRGGRGPGWPPENTIEAFEHARTQGARAIELDARTCADDVVVFHDATLDRMSGDRSGRRVRDMPAETLQRMDLGGGARIPSLSLALEWARDRGMAVNVELKHDGSERVALVRTALRLTKQEGGDVLLSSFDPLLLAMAGALGHRAPRALLVHPEQPWWAYAFQENARPPLVQALHLERTQCEPLSLARYAAKRLRLGAWTVNDPREAQELVRLGIATIVTDSPGTVLDALTVRS
jgi:glycerophosphoryl diester phosphodiesterase